MKKKILIFILIVIIFSLFGCKSEIHISNYEDEHYYLYEGKSGYFYIDKTGNVSSDNGKELYFDDTSNELPLAVRKGLETVY